MSFTIDVPDPEVLLISAPSVDFDTFTGACQETMGYSPLRAADSPGRDLSEAEKFLGCLATFRAQQVPASLPPNLLSHVSFSVFVVAGEEDMFDILERCAGMAFVSTEMKERRMFAFVISGTLAQWRDAVAAGSVREAKLSVRAGFQKVYDLFCDMNVNVWGDYNASKAPDGTLLLEYKPLG